MSRAVRSEVENTLDEASQAARAKLQELTLADLLYAEMASAEPVHGTTPPSIGIQVHVMESKWL
jgi:DNA-binding IscR family transcriptional regulator